MAARTPRQQRQQYLAWTLRVIQGAQENLRQTERLCPATSASLRTVQKVLDIALWTARNEMLLLVKETENAKTSERAAKLEQRRLQAGAAKKKSAGT